MYIFHKCGILHGSNTSLKCCASFSVDPHTKKKKTKAGACKHLTFNTDDNKHEFRIHSFPSRQQSGDLLGKRMTATTHNRTYIVLWHKHHHQISKCSSFTINTCLDYFSNEWRCLANVTCSSPYCCQDESLQRYWKFFPSGWVSNAVFWVIIGRCSKPSRCVKTKTLASLCHVIPTWSIM